MILDLSEFNHDPKVKAIEVVINTIAEAFEKKTITKEEYASLMRDVDYLRLAVSAKNQVELNQKIHDAVVMLVELAKMAKF